MSSDDEEPRKSYQDNYAAESGDEDEQRPFDSSEEEEEDDEAEMQKVREGFIVDEENDDEEEDNDDGVSSSKHKKKKRRHNKEEEALDEDDLDLLMENTGAAPRVKSKFKRLKKASEEDDEDEQARGSFGRKRDALDDIFSDDDSDNDVEDKPEEVSQTRRHVDEMDDFIEEDSDVEDGGQNRATRDRRYRPAPTSSLMAMPEVKDELLEELFEIFGDGSDYQWALDMEDHDDFDENEADDEEGDGVPKLTDIFEKTELQEKMLTEEDNQVRITDIPERFQAMRSMIKDYELSPTDFDMEKTWIQDILGAEKVDFLSKNDYLLEPFRQAVNDVLTFICEDNLEVPFIWTHRKDFIIYSHDERVDELLNEDDLWKITQLDIEFHGLLKKRQSVVKLLTKLDLLDDFEMELNNMTKVEDLQDLYDYIIFTYSKKLVELKEDLDEIDEEVSEDEEDDDDYNFNKSVSKKKSKKSKLKMRKHSKFIFWDRIRDSDLKEMLEAFGIDSGKVGENFGSPNRIHETLDNDLSPTDILGELCSRPGALYSNEKIALNMVLKLYAEGLFYEPKIRTVIRDAFANFSTVNVKLTEKGRVKIMKGLPNYDFKYLIKKKIASFANEPDLFLRMLKAEQDSLIEIDFQIDAFNKFVDHVFDKSLGSSGNSDVSYLWNKLRKQALDIAMKKLTDLAKSSLREILRKQSENIIYFKVRKEVSKKLMQAPYQPPGFVRGAVPYTLTISWGEGNASSDAVVGIYMNEFGEVKDFIKFEHSPIGVTKELFQEELTAKIKKLRPDVVGINGYNVRTKRLYDLIKETVETEELRPSTHQDGDYSEFPNNEPPILQVIFVPDDVARLYQNSDRAVAEFPNRGGVFRYCIGLGRYLQSPLLEYANLNKDVKSVYFYKHQHLLSDDKLQDAIETVLVDVVNMVGVDINRALRESYYATILQYVAGLGPRKASGLIRSIQTKSTAGLISRAQLITLQFTPKNIFMNCSSFLKFTESITNRYTDEADVLDETRIHPEDYVLATKMAADALDLDEEDIDDLDKNEGLIRKLEEDNNLNELSKLVLEDYAAELERKRGKKKLATLHMIREELTNHYDELRRKFHILHPKEVFISLTGETEETFYPGVVCTVVLKKVSDKRFYGNTQFLVQCDIPSDKVLESRERRRVDEVYHVQQAVKVKILSIDYENFSCEGSLLKRDVLKSEDQDLRNRDPNEWDTIAEENDLISERNKVENEDKPKKFIKHAFFRNFNARQAEEYLSSFKRGDLIIRPSSKGNDHLAITWKVDTNLYQHLDVLEKTSTDNDGQEVKNYYVHRLKYTDLDELITFHVAKLAKNVESMINHDKFVNKPKSEVEKYINSYVSANTGRGFYSFCYDYSHPGKFLLLFKGGEKSPLHSIPVDVTPNGYKLYLKKNSYDYASVGLLINGFKQLMKSRSGGNRGRNGQLQTGSASRYGGRSSYNGKNTAVYNNNYGRY